MWFVKFAACTAVVSIPLTAVYAGSEFHRSRWPALNGSYKQSLIPTPFSSAFPFHPSFISRNPRYDTDPDELLLKDTIRSVYLITVGLLSKLVMDGFNKTETRNVDEFLAAVKRRPSDRPLITVSNHVHAADDPFTIAAMVPTRDLFDARKVRWTFCATDRCFKTPSMSRFFEIGKVIPIQRSGGIMQPSMLLAVNKLERGDWLHIFPEGTRSPTQQIGRMKPGM